MMHGSPMPKVSAFVLVLCFLIPAIAWGDWVERFYTAPTAEQRKAIVSSLDEMLRYAQRSNPS